MKDCLAGAWSSLFDEPAIMTSHVVPSFAALACASELVRMVMLSFDVFFFFADLLGAVAMCASAARMSVSGFEYAG